MLGHLLGYVGFHGRPFFGGKNLQQNPLVLRVFSGTSWAYVGPFGGYVGPMLGDFGFKSGPSWAICSVYWAYFEPRLQNV